MTTAMEALGRFLETLRPHDTLAAVAILILIRRARDDGTIDYAEWLDEVDAAFAELQPDTLENTAPGAAIRRFERHVLPRLAGTILRAPDEAAPFPLAEGSGERAPPASKSEAGRTAVLPEFWAAIAPRRHAAVADLEIAVRNLLHAVDRDLPAAPAPAGGDGHAPNGTSTLTAHGLVKVYRKRKVVNEVDISVAQGEIVGLLGPNGAGKTTTFYAIVGLISPDRGKVYLDDEELTRVPMYRRARRGIGYLAQEPSIFRKLTVEQNIMAILETLPLSRAERRARIEVLLDELNIKHLRKTRAYALSGGERRRLEITRALVGRPKFMLLDEPFAGVDPIAVHDIQQIVAGLRHRGIGVIITDHNVEQTLDIVDRAYIMYDGRVRVSGSVAELVWNDEVAEIYLGPTLTARMRERYNRPEPA